MSDPVRVLLVDDHEVVREGLRTLLARRPSVADDGVGFDAQGTAHGKGLRSIEDRVRSIGATLAIDSAPGAGTRLRVDIPAVTLIA